MILVMQKIRVTNKRGFCHSLQYFIICSLPGMEKYKSSKVAALSPNQCPPWRPALANVEREITTLRFPLIFFSALIKEI